jgi:hypothetical protein
MKINIFIQKNSGKCDNAYIETCHRLVRRDMLVIMTLFACVYFKTIQGTIINVCAKNTGVPIRGNTIVILRNEIREEDHIRLVQV